MQHPATPSLILNIGLAIDSTGEQNTVTQVIQALERAGFDIQALRVDQSDTERTVVAQVESTVDYGIDPLQADAITRVSIALAQDCIAVWEAGSQTGLLLGPRPYPSGFLPQYFLTLTGARLSDAPPAWASATRDQSEDRRQPFSLEQLAHLGRRSAGDPVPAWLAAAEAV